MPEIAHTGWQVNTIDPSAYVTDAAGDLQYGARVRFTTGAGNKGSVFLLNEVLTPANVAAAINRQAALLDAIAVMSADPVGMVV